jgi:hypothetical protein
MIFRSIPNPILLTSFSSPPIRLLLIGVGDIVSIGAREIGASVNHYYFKPNIFGVNVVDVQ